jgi:enamine deaminase RidA (YjgF/YER057c/UK114 family)
VSDAPDAPRRQRISSGGPWEERVGYSRAVRVDGHVWVTGSTGTRPDGTVVEGIAAQTRLALDVIGQALHEAGATFGDVVAVRVYVVDFAEFEGAVTALRERFGDVRPAMTAVQAAALIDPRHRIEIECEAVVGSAA